MSTLNTPKHSMFLSFLFLIWLVSFSAATTEAATYTVTNSDDSGPGSLRQAIIDANGSADNDTIEFDLSGCPCVITLTSGGLFITNNGTLTINGPGADQLSVSGNNTRRVFFVSLYASAEINGLTVTGGRVVGSFGGGIYNDGSLTLTETTVSGNSAQFGGGIANTGTMTVNNSTVSGNSGAIDGGGIATFFGATLTLTNSTVSGNWAGNVGGGIRSRSVIKIENSTISNNQAGAGNGGISISTMATLINTIIADSTNGDCGTDGTINASYSLIEGGLGCVNGTNLNNHSGDPMLGPLANNGGPTMTHALLPGSPAIDAGGPTDLLTDQRGSGFHRVVGAAADIGAFELDPDTDGDGVNDSRDNCPTTPNAEKIAFRSNRDGNGEIYVINPDGTQETRLTNNIFGDDEPEFSPDGSKIVFNSTRDGDNGEIYIMNADGSDPVRLTNVAGYDGTPTFSPDGSKIAFTSVRDGINRYQLYIMNADGTGQVRLSNGQRSDFSPQFSPDGGKIVFSSSFAGNAEIYLMNSDGTGQIALTSSSTNFSPSFSPDGSKIAFYSRRDGNHEIYLMNADGSGQTRITSNLFSDNGPIFSPDGNRIVFSSSRTGSFQLFVMNVDGSNETRLTQTTSSDGAFSWGRQADSDGDGVGDACDNSAPVVSATPLTQSVQYSDAIAPVTISASDAETPDDLTISFTHTKDGGPVVEDLPSGMSFGGVCGAGNVCGIANVPSGSYAITVSATDAGGLSSTASFTVVVTRENAVAAPHLSNAVSKQVDSPGGTASGSSGQICFDITELADGSAGDTALIDAATVTISPVGGGSGGSTIASSAVTFTSPGGVGEARTACVNLSLVNTPANVYEVMLTIGGSYYTGTGTTVFTVFDPSAGFASGGGWIINPNNGYRANYGIHMKYARNGNVQGSILYVEHRPDGDYKVKSTALAAKGAFAIIPITGGAEARMTGKATVGPEGASIGNHSFVVRMIDMGTPGTNDRLGLKVIDPAGQILTLFTFDPVLIGGGNNQVPKN